MRVLAGILLLTGPALADRRPQIEPLPRLGLGASFIGHVGTINGTPATGVGPSLDVAVGAGRAQYVAEATLAWVTLAPADAGDPSGSLVRGSLVRGAVGVRWLARSMDFERSGAIELPFELTLGIQRYALGDDRVVRPELAAGLGLQIRKYRRPRIAGRLVLRAFWAPTDDDTRIATRGAVSNGTASNTGVIITFGVMR